MTMKKTTIAAALTIFFVLAGTEVGNAFWSAQATTSSTVSAGAIGVSQSGFGAFQMTYSATDLVAAAPITVTNTGTITAPFALTLAAQSAGTLAAGARVRTWTVGSAGGCTASAMVPATATDTNWTNIPVLTGTLAPSLHKIYCVRASITAAQQTSLAASSMVGTLSLVSALGSWSASVTALTPTHTVADTAAPSVPVAPSASVTSNTQTTLSWPASTDNVGVTAYAIYRGGVLLTTAASTSFTDTGLTAGTTYTYTITATDAAGNVSVNSAATSVVTLALTSTTNYKVKPVTGTNLCINHAGSSPGAGVALVTSNCQGNSQPWTVVSTLGGYYKIVYPHPSKLFAWEVNGSIAQLGADTGTANQQWEIVQRSAGLYSLVNRVSGNCIETPVALGAQLQQRSCTGASAQSFLLVP